ncbi:co-chaperone GroES [Tetragenococcus muriaticus]|uniref:Co-chaperonin GroES n=2 Tax=Tetragenococcus muriaticus TaxID=64642 RepID=A0A091C0W3_9ENTE|nr:co-chaperone GroES [Tetragenococcus muriaticus]KFN91466.1 heat shock protein 60 family co-chaperone [Tetragenococcus muriaticus 3MR10-3]KFN91919.1 heat shock protein 60 family co-chaperone [Tetragenococcus muriaticus PMC-11-5]GMA46705.1 10 kDa chaperonin [Tetragenococcus muriaticus]
MLKPLGDRVLVEVSEEEEKTVGGIVLASTAKEKPQTGKVVAIGDGRTLENGEVAQVPVNVGDIVLFEKYTGSEVKYDGQDYMIFSAKDIVAIVE